jgi:hypothetical protein
VNCSDPAVAADDEHVGNRLHPVLLADVVVGVADQREIGAVAVQDVLDLHELGRVLAPVDREDNDLGSSRLLLNGREHADLLAAGRTPRRPKRYDDDPAAVVAQLGMPSELRGRQITDLQLLSCLRGGNEEGVPEQGRGEKTRERAQGHVVFPPSIFFEATEYALNEVPFYQ